MHGPGTGTRVTLGLQVELGESVQIQRIPSELLLDKTALFEPHNVKSL